MTSRPKPKGTILTVGLTFEPVVFSLQQIQPDYAAFVCTPESAKTLDDVLSRYGINPSHIWRREVFDRPDQIGRLVHEFYAAFLWLRDQCHVAPSDIYTDPTPGRKWMSAGTTMLASFLGLNMYYTDVRFVDQKPDPSTMKFVPLGNAYEQTGFLEAEKGRDLFNRYEFSSAAQIFDRLHPRVSAQADLFAGLGKLSRVLHRWELFEHYDQSLAEQFNDAFTDLGRCAYSTLLPEGFEEFLNEARRLAAAIQEITAETKPTFLATADLVLNAERRLSQGHYDDAVARCYRALESLSQLYLSQFKLDPSRPDYNILSPAQRDKVVAQVSLLPKEISLENGWRILFALGHPAARQIYHESNNRKLHNRFQGLLDDRNRSILAHGWRPVGAERAREWVSRLKQLLNDVEGDKARSVLAKLQPPCLPGFWSAG